MKPELFWLALTATMTGLFWIPYILNRALTAGASGSFGLVTPPMDVPQRQAEWAKRAQRAHSNAVENLVVFAPLVLVAHLEGVSNQATATAAAVFFWARLAHYLVLTLGVPYARTLIWAVSWAAMMRIAWQVVAHA